MTTRRWPRMLAVGLLLLAVLWRVPSGAAPLPPALADPSARDADLARIARTLETRIAAARLQALGLDAEAVQARLARLDDAELRKLAEALPDAGVGGQDSEWERAAGAILIVLVVLAVFGALIYFSIASSPF